MLETDSLRQREQLRTLIEKSDSDGELIATMRQEMDRLKAQLRKSAMDSRAAAESLKPRVEGRQQHISEAAAGGSGMDAELRRLSRLCAQQVRLLIQAIFPDAHPL